MCASFKVVLISVVLASVALAAPPMPTFLRSLSGAESREFWAIRKNDALTKVQVATAEDVWIATKSEQVKTSYNEYKSNLATYNADLKIKYAAAAKNLTSKAKAVYDQIEGVKLNKNISYKQENDEITKIMDGTTEEIRWAVIRILITADIGDDKSFLRFDEQAPVVNVNLGDLFKQNVTLPKLSFDLGDLFKYSKKIKTFLHYLT
uniref:DUF148 domain-containing protein n=1 Tax=Rhabditophanes sp. KR3021 TaxID=114890 RepID=A0AC35TWS9_9BILA